MRSARQRDRHAEKVKPGRENEICRVTFLGHSSVLIRMDGKSILADPNLSRRIFFFIRRRTPAPPASALKAVDLILISHGHYDHLDLPTLRTLPSETPVIVPEGLERVVRWGGMKQVVTLQRWEAHHLGSVIVTAVPVKHFRGRPPLFPRTGYNGYVIEGKATVFFAGDSGLFEGMAEIGRKWDIDIALLPIGAYEPRSFRRHHMSPEDALEAGRMLRAKVIVPIHWGTFKLSLEPFDEPARRLKEAASRAGLSSMVRILLPSESLVVRGDASIETIGD
ncbi:MAG: MBL fold metallo-hydrolase [Candidatus Abyssobacteria bacterium SURF_17]|uniref:MBL fold metallo-hydrolase n=1 Tax=Candidatus Abyssobacteria bacterium SURF_17 TaxID=2093361 RepID=A0A419EWX5_9BACT|nr:MAG: MBL fold metallo-hydrolase [Candidatus Abyssubacteria bacterium SURF_17]